MKRFLIDILLALSLSAVVTSCDKPLGGDAQTDEVQLQAFGPSPVLRGTAVTFIGNNLDKVTAVVFPEGLEVTEITRESAEKISAVVPQAAVEGHVKLIHPEGEIESKALISYQEPISISSLSPLTAMRAGDEIVIAGDYLYNITSVVFMGGAAVLAEEFTSQTRSELKLPVPAAALSGKIYVEDEFGNQLYSDEELIITQPIAGAASPATIKAGATLTIAGTNLDLIESVTFVGGTKVSLNSVTRTAVTVVVPANAQDGAVTLTALSGVQTVATNDITLVVPSNLAIAAERYKAGSMLTISGDDLDLVTGVSFAAGVASEFVLSGADINTQIPATAVNGVITLSMASGKSVETPAYELVVPTVTSATPSEIVAGEQIVIAGTDLDLVTAVKINGKSVTILEGVTAEQITVETPLDATSGDIALVLENGVSVAGPAVVINPSTKPTVTSMPSAAMPGQAIVFEGTNLNNVADIYFGDAKVTQYTERTPVLLAFTIPATAAIGTYAPYLEVYEGENLYTSSTMTVFGRDPVLPTDIMVMDFQQHGDHNGDWDGSWSGATNIVHEGDEIYCTTNACGSGSWILNCNHQGNGAPAPVIENAENYIMLLDVRVAEQFTPDDYFVAFIVNDNWALPGIGWTKGLYILDETGAVDAASVGQWITVSFDLAALGVTGTLNCSAGTYGMFLQQGTIPAGVSFDNWRFRLKE